MGRTSWRGEATQPAHFVRAATNGSAAHQAVFQFPGISLRSQTFSKSIDGLKLVADWSSVHTRVLRAFRCYDLD